MTLSTCELIISKLAFWPTVLHEVSIWLWNIAIIYILSADKYDYDYYFNYNISKNTYDAIIANLIIAFIITNIISLLTFAHNRTKHNTHVSIYLVLHVFIYSICIILTLMYALINTNNIDVLTTSDGNIFKFTFIYYIHNVIMFVFSTISLIYSYRCPEETIQTIHYGCTDNNYERLTTNTVIITS